MYCGGWRPGTPREKCLAIKGVIMSVARGFFDGKSVYTNIIKKQIDINLSFIVDSTNGNGLGIRSLKSNGFVESVYMNTSAAFTGTYNNSINVTGISTGTATLKVGMPVQGSGIPALATIASIVSSSAITLSAATTGGSTTGSITYQGFARQNYPNPNPAAGYALIQFKNNFNVYLGGFNGFVSQLSGSSINVTTGVTAGLSYVITAVGTTTLAQWQKLGVPAGLVPAVGLSFVAPVTTTATGSGTMQVPAAAGAGNLQVDVIGDPNQSIANSNIAVNAGAYLLIRFLGATNSSTTTLVAKAPADGATVGLMCRFDGSAVSVDGL